MNKLKDMKIRTKILVSMMGAILLFVIVGVALISLLHLFSNKYAEIYNMYGVTTGQVGDANTHYYLSIARMEEAFLAENLEDVEKFVVQAEEGMATVSEELALAVQGIEDEDIVAHVKELSGHLEDFESYCTQIIAYLRAGTEDPAKALFGSDEFNNKEAVCNTMFHELTERVQNRGLVEITDIENQRDMAGTLCVIVMVVCFGLSILAGILISKIIAGPIIMLKDAAIKVAEGDIDVSVKRLYNDELGELTDEMMNMADNIRKQAEVAQKMSEGNYDVDIEVYSEKDVLGVALETMITEENRVMGNIRQAVGEVRTGAEQIAAVSQSLAQGSTEQASAIQQVTATIDELLERTKVNANEATQASTLVAKAKEDAKNGNSKMREMIAAMSDINQSSENISKIIKVIDDIAFQTNILALNAAVEAARAGQHGRGFAVVAEEVRNLAGKSAQAASETAEMIEDSISKVVRGSKLAEETAAALEEIVKAIDTIMALSDSIAKSSNDQSTAINQIDMAVNQVSQVVQTNSATSEQCAAASEELSAHAAKLRELIMRYRLKATESFGVSDSPFIKSDRSDIRDDVPPVISLDDNFGKY